MLVVRRKSKDKMNLIFIALFLILTIAIVVTLGILIYKTEKEIKMQTITTIQGLLESMSFPIYEIYFINKHLTIALNGAQTKIAVIENFNPKNPTYYSYKEIMLSFIERIELGTTIKLHYFKKGEVQTLNIYPASAEVKDFIHRIYLHSYIKRIETKYPDFKFDTFASSNWSCDFVWGFSKKNGAFTYFQTGAKPVSYKINLKKENFTIDTKYKYFEAPIFGIPQQLLIFEKDFLDTIFDSMIEIIKKNYNPVVPNSIYYDNFKNVIYLTNGTTSLQSIVISEVKEVEYKDNRLSFELLKEGRIINYLSNHQQIADFENFLINYILQKITNNFEKKVDKLINTTQSTKFIIDFSRDRIIYCANLNKFNSFSYMIISFSELKDAKINKTGLKHFVRITTNNNQIIDATCDKKEVALYIEATIEKIVKGDEIKF